MGTHGSLGFEPIATSHWMRAAPQADPAPRLGSQIDCDVAVIGAGYTGLVSALTLAEAGRRVCVLEAEQPGWAASGRNAGQIIPMMWGAHKSPARMTAHYGEKLGARMNALAAAAGRNLFALIERHGIQCDAQRGYVCLMRNGKSLNLWQSRLEAWRAHGGRFEALDRNALSRYVVSPRYAGGFYLPDGGRVNPLSLSRGLAGALRRAGGLIFGNSRALRVERDGGGWRVATALGAVRSRIILVGAGGYADSLFPVLQKVGIPMICGVVATDPLPDHGASFLPGGVPMADMDDPAVFAPSVDAQGCLVVSYMVGARQPELGRALNVVGPRLKRAFPQLQPPPFRRHWLGRFLISMDGVPSLMRLDENVFAAAVCNGVGHTLGISAALQLARLAQGVPDSDIDLPVTTPRPTSGARVLPGLLRRVVMPLANSLGV
ncbi:MAG TPA: FAD-binding oxidoreductase [Steroidobacteraceae bacterium]|nr:FAD-binding oxidoreductase [Steroidobacteraceae bacterium]